jgi:DNA repair exonuclease SbcCD ATPase subunit
VRITRLHLRNYRVYEEPLDLEIPAGVVGIYGPNGAGKSYLIESILWTLFGRARTSKDEVRTAGVNADCVTEVEFEHEGHLYLVRRTISGINSTVKAEAHADRLQVAEGVNDVKKYVHSILGMDDAAFRASVFAEQKQVAAFSQQTAAERRKLVLKLLGITPLDGARDQARRDAKTAIEQHDRVRSLLPNLDALKVAVEDARSAAEARATEAKSEATALETAKEKAANADAAFAKLDDIRQEHEKLVADGKAVRTELDGVAKRVDELTKELAELATAHARLAELKPAVDGLATAEARLKLLELVQQAEAAVAAVAIGGTPPPTPDPDGAEKLAEAATAAREAAAQIDGALNGAKQELERAEAAVHRSAELTPGALCPLCGQALGDAFERVLAHRTDEVEEARTRVSALTTQRDELMASAATATKQAKQAATELAKAQEAWAVHQKLVDRRSEAERMLAEARALLDPPATEGEIDDIRRRVKDGQAAAAECQRLQGRLERQSVAESELESAKARHGDLDGRRQALLEKVHSLDFQSEKLDAARTERELFRGRVEAATTAANQAALVAERAKVNAEAEAKRLEDGEKQHEQLATLADDSRHLGRLADLLNLFRNAVVATVGPALAAQAAALFAELTDHEYDLLQVDPDTYDIQIVDGGHEYGMDRFSGSETDLANLALRVAISEHVRFLSGGAVGLLVLDEVFGPLDEDRKTRMLQALEHLKGRFRQILVVTHDVDIKQELPNAIQVLKLPGRRATAQLLNP